MNLIAGVISIVAERDSSNKAAAEMPHVLPHQLVMLRGRELSDILKIQTPRLRTTCSITEIDIIEQEFAQLQSAYHRESSFKAMLDACGPHTSFKEDWKLTQDRFCFLQEFCGTRNSFSRHLNCGKRFLDCEVGEGCWQSLIDRLLFGSNPTCQAVQSDAVH